MTLDVHLLRDDGGPGALICQIDDAALRRLEQAFDLFEARTGCRVDPYGDLRLWAGSGTLIQSLRLARQQEPDAEAQDEIDRFMGALMPWNDGVTGIGFFGD